MSAGVWAAPEPDAQLAVIAAGRDLWKQDVEYNNWGYTVTDLDHNGRYEIISCSVQGTGFYSYIQAFEVNEAGDGLTDLMADLKDRTDSSPDIMTDRVTFYSDPQSGQYYYIFNDMIRNGMAEYYENTRAVSVVDGKWTEMPLASKSTVYTDQDHYTITCSDKSGNAISESQYGSIAEEEFRGLGSGEICLQWQMTDNNAFAALSVDQLTASLKAGTAANCP